MRQHDLRHIVIATSRPKLLFRTCSFTSAGRLESGRYFTTTSRTRLSDSQLLLEFDNYSKDWQKSPTSLISTTTNFLRALYIAMKKHSEAENVNDRSLFFIVPGDDNDIPLYYGQELAERQGWTTERCQDFQYEYLSE